MLCNVQGNRGNEKVEEEFQQREKQERRHRGGNVCRMSRQTKVRDLCGRMDGDESREMALMRL